MRENLGAKSHGLAVVYIHITMAYKHILHLAAYFRKKKRNIFYDGYVFEKKFCLALLTVQEFRAR